MGRRLTPSQQAERQNLQNKMKHKLLTITPNMAKEFLANNCHKGPPRKRVVDRLADDMKCGRWILTPHFISFLADGRLADGLHRLAAIVQAGIPVQMFAAYDVDQGEEQSVVEEFKREFSAATPQEQQAFVAWAKQNMIKETNEH